MTGRRRDAAILAALLLVCVLLGVAGGKDLNWDLAHYHVYVAFSLLHGRLGNDFMGASLHSYLNPLPHLPLYGMLAAGWESVAIGALLALTQGVALVLLYYISRFLLPEAATRGRAGAILCVLLGAAAVPYVSALGRAFTDILTALPVLAAIALFCSNALGGRPALRMALIGLLLGAAGGLKPTNAIYALAALVLPLMHGGERAKALAAYAAGAAAGVLMTGGWWALALWREFGNPVFPLFNALFHSPDFPSVNISFERYRPRELAAFLSAPLRMAQAQGGIYGELNAPELRFALLIVLLAALPVARLVRRAPAAQAPPAKGALAPLLAFFVIALVLWIVTSFNARYAITLLLLVGPLLGAALSGLLIGRAWVAVMLLALAAQGFAILQVSPTRLSPADPYAWTHHWLEFNVPEPLRREPHLFIGMDRQSYSFLVLYFHPDSRLAAVRGAYAVHLDGPGGDRLRGLLERYDGRTRTLGGNALEPGQSRPAPAWVQAKDEVLGRLGLAVNAEDCLPIETAEETDALSDAANRLVGMASHLPKRFIMSCGLRRVPISESYLRGRGAADAVLDAAERACPRAFLAGIARSEQAGLGMWTRSYPATEVDLFWDGKQSVFAVSQVNGRFTSVGAVRPAHSFTLEQCPSG
jgi:hypothetical protein